jgi:hypothetical protein
LGDRFSGQRWSIIQREACLNSCFEMKIGRIFLAGGFVVFCWGFGEKWVF